MFGTPEELFDFMQDFEYKDFDTLMSAIDVYLNKSGSCHDQTLFEYSCLRDMKLRPHARFLIAVDKDNIGGETHSFVYWVANGHAYWFENAWEDYKGIHEFNSVPELIDAVVDAFTERNPRKYIYISNLMPADHTIGEDLETFVDICMNDAVLAM